MSGVDIDIPVTLRTGVEHNIGRLRVLVLRHVYGEKPHFKLLGPSTDVTCPACSQAFRSAAGVRVHFAIKHSHVPWPWKNKWR